MGKYFLYPNKKTVLITLGVLIFFLLLNLYLATIVQKANKIAYEGELQFISPGLSNMKFNNTQERQDYINQLGNALHEDYKKTTLKGAFIQVLSQFYFYLFFVLVLTYVLVSYELNHPKKSADNKPRGH
jgi:hypothetical protein